MVEISNNTKAKVDFKIVKHTVDSFLSFHKLQKKSVSVAFVGDRKIKILNKNYRGKDKITDILSFCGEGCDLGEIVICYPQIKRQAKKFSDSEKQELVFILVHGLLHLLGYTDDTDKEALKMEKLGQKFINHLGLC